MRALLLIALLPVACFAQLSSPLSTLELFFEADSARPDGSATFFARGQNYQFSIRPTEADLVLCKVEVNVPGSMREFHIPRNLYSVSTRPVRLHVVGANTDASAHGELPLPGKINYLLGNDPAAWRTGLPTYARVHVQQVYPGIDMLYYGNQQRLEYDFNVSAGADPSVIVLRFQGADQLSLGKQGELIMTLGTDEIHQPRPTLYQVVREERKTIEGGYRLIDAHTVGFKIGNYDHDLPLVIDPLLNLDYSSYFGGNVADIAGAIKVDTNNGKIYIAGITLSTQFSFSNSIPANGFPGAYTNRFQGGSINGDGFVARLTPSGTNLVLDYLTYLGGSLNDGIYDMALAADGSGGVYVTGFTDSTNFPVRPLGVGVQGLSTRISGAADASFGVFPVDAFVSLLAPNGSGLIYSTYIGGAADDIGDAIAVDAMGDAYVAGFTFSTNFPVTNAFQTSIGSTNNADAFLAVIAPGGGSPYLAYSTYFGGTNIDEAEGVAVGTDGFAYVSGYTASTNFPITTNALQTELDRSTNAATQFKKTPLPPYDGFIARFDPLRASGLSSLIYSTYLGGTNSDGANRLAIDAFTNVYVTGYSDSADFPNTASNAVSHGVLGTNRFNSDAFLTKISFATNPPAIVYSALFGGTNNENGWGVAVDPGGSAFVVGYTDSTNYPVTNVTASLMFTTNALNNVFVTAFNSDASALVYSGVFGGSRDDYAFGIALDPATNAYVIGRTLSTNFPVTASAFAPAMQRTNNAFLSIIQMPQSLSESIANGELVLRWGASPTVLPQFTLQSANAPMGTANWTPVAASPTVTNGFNTVTLPLTNGVEFFRLVR